MVMYLAKSQALLYFNLRLFDLCFRKSIQLFPRSLHVLARNRTEDKTDLRITIAFSFTSVAFDGF